MELREELLSQALQLRSELLTQQQQLTNEFLSHVSHELRSPLTAIYQFTTILLDGLAGELNDDQREYLGIALRNVQQLQAMIDDLLTASRARAGALGVRPARVALSAAVGDAIEALAAAAEAKGVALSAEANDELPAAYADPALVRQILIHLLHNAIKFSPPGGEVRARVGLQEGESGVLVVEIEDTGCGIEAEQLSSLFDRFAPLGDSASSPRQGIGLGLFIASALVKRQGGRLWATSVPGRGSRFSFTVPQFSLVPVIAPVAEQARRRRDSLTLVVVDVSADRASVSAAEFGATVARARGIVEPCLVPGFEVLVPVLGGAPTPSRLFIVAAVEENSGQSAVDRMHEHLDHAESLRGSGLRFAVSDLSLEPLSAALLPAERLAALAAKVEHLIRLAPAAMQEERRSAGPS